MASSSAHFGTLPHHDATQQYDFKDIPIDIFIGFILPALPGSYWFLLQRLSRGLLNAGQQLLRRSPVLDFINLPVKHSESYLSDDYKFDAQYDAFKFVLRTLKRHESTREVVPAAVAEEYEEDPKGKQQDTEFSWIYKSVSGIGTFLMPKETLSTPDFVCTGVTHLRLPSFLDLERSSFEGSHHMRILLQILPNLKSITVCDANSEIVSLFKNRFSFPRKCVHYNLEEIICVRGRYLLGHMEDLIESSPITFPKLKSLVCIACENAGTDQISQGQARTRNNQIEFEFRVWDYQKQEFEGIAYQSTNFKVSFVNGLYTVKPSLDYKQRVETILAILTKQAKAALTIECAQYLLDVVGIFPFMRFNLREMASYAKATLVDLAMNPLVPVAEQYLDTFLAKNGTIDLFSSVLFHTWMVLFALDDPFNSFVQLERVKMLARLARKHCHGRLLKACILKKLLKDIPILVRLEIERLKSASTATELYRIYTQKAILMLQTMVQHGWDMYSDDYLKAAVENDDVFCAILDLDKENQLKGESSSQNDQVAEQERNERFRYLLLYAAKGGNYASIPIILQLAGDSFVNVILDPSLGTIVTAVLIQPFEYYCVTYVLSKKPLDWRDDKGRTYLHIAAMGHQTEAALLDLAGYIDVNAVDCDGNTMLHYLCKRNLVSAARLAVAKFGANSSVRNVEGKYPADLLGNTRYVPLELRYDGYVELPIVSVTSHRGVKRAKEVEEHTGDAAPADPVEPKAKHAKLMY